MNPLHTNQAIFLTPVQPQGRAPAAGQPANEAADAYGPATSGAQHAGAVPHMPQPFELQQPQRPVQPSAAAFAPWPSPMHNAAAQAAQVGGRPFLGSVRNQQIAMGVSALVLSFAITFGGVFGANRSVCASLYNA